MIRRRAWPLLMKDDRAVVAPLVAVLGASLLAAAGLALDVGLYYTESRDLRNATEAAALAAAMNPAAGAQRARDYLARNGYDASVLKSVQVGRYCPDVRLPAGQRFDASFSLCPGNGRGNAVRIRTERPSRRFLSRLLGPANPIPDLGATATAARIDEAGVGITSGILTVTNSLVTSVNNLLGALLGIKLRLSTADVEALMNGNVDEGLFFDELARRVGETGTYGDLVGRTVPLRDLLAAAAEAAADPATAATLSTLSGVVGSGYTVPLAGLFGLGVQQNMPVGEADAKPALRAGLNAYQLLTFAVQAGPGVIDLSDAVSLLVGGSTVRIGAVATGPVDRPRFSFGPEGETSVGTSALRLQLFIGLGNISVLGSTLSVDSVPVLIDVAAATASIARIECDNTAEQASNTRVTVNAASGLVNAYIGTAPANAMTRPMPVITASSIKSARLVNVASLITVDARAVAQPVMGVSGSVLFGPGGQATVGSPSAPGTAATVGNGSQVGTLLTSLISSISASEGLQVRILGLCLPLVCDATAGAVRSQLLGAVVNPLAGLVGTTADPLLDNLLAALGIRLGHTTLWVTGARCGVPVLV